MFQVGTNFKTALGFVLAAGFSIMGATEAEAGCRISTYPSVSATWPGFGNVFYNNFPVDVRVSPSSTTSDSNSSSSNYDNCGTSSYTVRVSIDNRYVYSNLRSVDVSGISDGPHILRIDYSDNYSSASASYAISVRNKWVRPEVFDLAYYNAYNPDVPAAFGGQPFSIVAHWLNAGIYEGRRSTNRFSVREYLGNYADLQNAFGANNFPAAVDHYITNGIAEQRQGLSIAANPIQPLGFFSNGTDAIFYSNGGDAYCGFANPDDMLLSGARPDGLDVRRRTPGSPISMRYDGICRVAEPKGFFQAGGTIFYSNGSDAFCGYNSWEKFVAANGGSTDTSGVRQRNSTPSMRYDGVCQ